MINIPKPFSDEIVQCWASQDYRQAEYLHQQEIETDPSNLSNYWYLGLALLLQEREEEAQMTWTLPFLEADEGQVERWTRELIELLDIEASNSASQKPEAAWLIRQHIREISPNQINNNLLLILLSIQLDRLQSDWFQDWGIIEQLHSSSNLVNAEILSVVLRTILRQFDIDQPAVELLQVGMPLILDRGDDFCQTLIQTANRIAFALKKPDLAVQLGELCLPLISQSDEDNRHNILIQLSTLYQENRQYSEAVSLEKKAMSYLKLFRKKLWLFIVA